VYLQLSRPLLKVIFLLVCKASISEAKVNKKQVQCKNLHRDEKCLSIFQSVSTVFPKSTVQIQVNLCGCASNKFIFDCVE
jgi:hypothetical protein